MFQWFPCHFNLGINSFSLVFSSFGVERDETNENELLIATFDLHRFCV